MPSDIGDDFELVALLRGRDDARSIGADGSAGRSLDQANVPFLTVGSLRTPRGWGGEEAAKVAKPAKVRVLPPDEIFLGLAVASIVLLFEIGVLVLLAN